MQNMDNDMDMNMSGRNDVNPVEVQQYLRGVDYPMSKQDITHIAEQRGAPRQIIDTIQQMADREYTTPADVNKELGRFT